MKIHSRDYHSMKLKYSKVRITLNPNIARLDIPSKKGSNKRRRTDKDVDEDEDISKTDTDYTNENTRKNKYTKYHVEIYENKGDEKTENETVNPKTINCPVCYEDVKISYVTTCNHNFCYNCVDKLMTTSKNQHWACPICRTICKK